MAAENSGTIDTKNAQLTHLASDEVIVGSEAQEAVHSLPFVGVVATHAELEKDQQIVVPETDDDPQQIIEGFFDRYMLNPHRGRTSADTEHLATYQKVFTDFLIETFDPEFIMKDYFPGQDYYPIAGEFLGMLASIDHNTGVYFSRDEAPEIFLAVTNHVVGDKSFKQRAEDATDSKEIRTLNRLVKSRLVETMSVENEITIPLVKGNDGHWRVVDENELNSGADFRPLEVIRQDNDDKGGWNKYRFRQPIYTRTKDETHTHEVAEGWYTSEWYTEPNYWSTELRHMLVGAAQAIDDELRALNAHTVMTTEGGIFKGTSTEGTDTDTGCIISCSTPADFDQAFIAADKIFGTSFKNLPFSTKNDGVSLRFFDRSKGQLYSRFDSGEYVASSYGEIFEGEYVFRIRKNEKGIGVTTSTGFYPYRKSGLTENDGAIHVSVNLETGATKQLSEAEVIEYKVMQEETRKAERERWEEATRDQPDVI